MLPAPQVRNQQDRQAYEAAWRESLAQEPSTFRRQHGVGIRVRQRLCAVACFYLCLSTAYSQDIDLVGPASSVIEQPAMFMLPHERLSHVLQSI